PARPPASRPPRGRAPAAGPGVLLPDAAVTGGRVRGLARDGLLLLVAAGADADVVHAAVASVPSPVRVLDLAVVDPAGMLAAALDARPGEVWVVRPDAHVAAVLTDPSTDALRAALDRAAGHADRPREESPDGVLQEIR
ncbi:MAG: hypothetical protein L0H64_17215, partial [Pseudonocardia sp.]|nr:hypothetical protein [Pseudonocardia sp.]